MDLKKYAVAVAVWLSASLAQAGVVFNNGAPAGDSHVCISRYIDCNRAGAWTVYDQFSLTTDATVTGFANWNLQAGIQGTWYYGTNWSIWSASPANSGVILYSGKSVGTVSDDGRYKFVSVDGLSLDLAAGTYWLGINHDASSQVGWTYAYSTSQPDNAVVSNGSDTFINRRALAFTISAVPEPETYAMLLAGLGLVGFAVRRQGAAA